jgi:hypothetical protein
LRKIVSFFAKRIIFSIQTKTSMDSPEHATKLMNPTVKKAISSLLRSVKVRLWQSEAGVYWPPDYISQSKQNSKEKLPSEHSLVQKCWMLCYPAASANPGYPGRNPWDDSTGKNLWKTPQFLRKRRGEEEANAMLV